MGKPAFLTNHQYTKTQSIEAKLVKSQNAERAI